MTITGQRPGAMAYRAPVGPVPGGGARTAAVLVGLGSVFVVVLMWLHGGGGRQLSAGNGQALASLGRLSGLVASILLLMQVVLIARVPWLERAYGQDRLARVHRWVGFTSFDLMVVHIVAITIGYEAVDGHRLLGEAWNLVTTYPGMLLAAGATAALTIVAVTSVRMARRRLRYESWHLLHLYAYLGIGLALPHELWTGSDLVSSPAARLFWWTTYVVAAGCLLGCRLLLPVVRSLRHGIRIAAIVPETPGVTSIYLRGRHLDRLPVRAGQFFTWRFAGPGWTRGHPFSLSAAPRPDLLRVTVKALGDDSADIHRLRVGARAFFEGPYGRLTGAVRRRPRMTMIACGIGVTPMRALLEAEPYRPGEAVLLYRVRGEADATFRAELDAIARARGAGVVYLPGRRGRGFLPAGYGDPAAALYRLVPYIAHSDVYVCGPEPWMADVLATLYTLGLRVDQIHLERFGW